MIKVALILMAAFLVFRCITVRLPKFEVNAVIVIVLLGQLLAIGFSIELWPFSPYPMFASIQGDEMVRLRLFGVTDEPEPREIPLIKPYCRPFGEPDITSALNRLSHSGDAQSAQRAALDCLRRYRRDRDRGSHDGPPIRAVRLYQATWQLEAWADDKQTPLKKRLLLEVSEPPVRLQEVHD